MADPPKARDGCGVERRRTFGPCGSTTMSHCKACVEWMRRIKEREGRG